MPRTKIPAMRLKATPRRAMLASIPGLIRRTSSRARPVLGGDYDLRKLRLLGLIRRRHCITHGQEYLATSMFAFMLASIPCLIRRTSSRAWPVLGGDYDLHGIYTLVPHCILRRLPAVQVSIAVKVYFEEKCWYCASTPTNNINSDYRMEEVNNMHY